VIGPVFFVWAGAKTAPKYQFVTAITLTVIHAIANGVIVTLVIVTGRAADPLWWLLLTCVLGIVATIEVCVGFHKEELESAARDESGVQSVGND